MCIPQSVEKDIKEIGKEKDELKEKKRDEQNQSFGLYIVQRLLLFICTLSMLLLGVSYSLPGPFYPSQAELRGLTASQYGFVFSVYDITGIMVSLISPVLIGKLGPKTSLILGMTIQGSLNIAMGLLQYVDDKLLFLTLSLSFRLIMGAARILNNVGAMTIVTCEFPLQAGLYTSILQSAFGLGRITGPLVGGVLFDLQGFFLPFATVGCVFVFITVVSSKVVPSHSKGTKLAVSDILRLMKKALNMSHISLAILSISYAISVTAFLATLLEPHLRAFHLSGTLIGLLFLLESLSFTTSSPIFGKLCDRGVRPWRCCVFGCLCIVFGISLIGPFPWIPVRPSIWAVGVGLFFVGAGVAGNNIPSLIDFRQTLLNVDFEDDEQTNVLVSCLFMFSIGLGGIIGPIIGGFLSDSFGFRISTLYVIAMGIILGILHICLNRRTTERVDDSCGKDNKVYVHDE